MSVEFIGSCSKEKGVSLKEFIEYLKEEDLVENVYGPFGREREQMALFFPEHGIRGFSATFMENEAELNFSFRQNILPSLSDWQSLLSALQFLLQFPECDIRDEDDNIFDHDILERWKSAEVYRQRHLFEVRGIVEQLKAGDDLFTFPTYPFDLEVFRKDLDFNASLDEQFDRVIEILEKQVEHYASCFIASIMVFRDKLGKEYSLIVWTPSIPTLAWEVDRVSLSEMFIGENRVVSFKELLEILGDRVKHIGSITANKKRVELPVLDFKKTQDLQLKKKILALKSVF